MLAENHEPRIVVPGDEPLPTEKRLHGFGLVERVAPRAFSQQDTFRLRVGKYDVDIGLRAPADVRIIGFDGIAEGAYATPSLSTIAIDFDQLARFTLDALIRRIDETHHADGTDCRPASRAIVGHRLIARESTGLTPC